MTTEPTNIDAPIHSVVLHAAAQYLGSLGEVEPEKLSAGDQLLQQLFFQHSLILSAVNSSISLRKSVTEAMQNQLAKLRGDAADEAPLIEEKPNNIIVPDRF